MRSMKTYLVTGGARGIGRAISERLLADGHRILISYNMGEKAANELADANPGRVEVIQADFSITPSLEKFVAKVRARGEIDGIVLNAGVIEFSSLEDTHIDSWQRVIDVNLTANWYIVRHLHDLIRPSGAVVAISSTDAFTSSYNSISYTVSKAALNALVDCFAVVLGEKRIRCVAVCPGWVDTDMSTEESFEAAKLTPLGRNGRPVDVASVVSFALSEDASFINGSPLIVDGGYGLVDYIVRQEAKGSQG